MGLIPPDLLRAVGETCAAPGPGKMSPEEALATLGFTVQRHPPRRPTGQGSRSTFKGKVEIKVCIVLPPERRTLFLPEIRLEDTCKPEQARDGEESMLRSFLRRLLREARSDAAAKRESLEAAAKREAAVAAACEAAGCAEDPAVSG